MSFTSNHQLRMPGFNVDLNDPPSINAADLIDGFPNALDERHIENGEMYNLVPHREILMMRVMNTITEKPQWDQKVFNEEITTKWRNEIAQSGQDVTPRMMDWVIKELQWKAGVLKEKEYLQVFDVGVVKSDTAISKEIQQALKEAVSPLENVPTGQKDYHPGSGDKVVDLVHPSLFPVIYGKTRVLPDRVIGLDDCFASVGQGEIVPVPPKEEISPISRFEDSNIPAYSDKFQWLPCDVELDTDGCRIVSYINNAHPVHHRGLYKVVEQIITQTIPLWNKSLSSSVSPRIKCTDVEYGEHSYPEPEGPEEGDVDEEAFDERSQRWYDTRPIILPEPESFVAPDESRESELGDLRKQFSDTGLQVIVKLANIELSPENATYEGGSWHIEGQLNERICATAIYYYDNENITENSLAFRHRGMADMLDFGYEQGQFQFLQAIFGFDDTVQGDTDDNVTQDLGAVSCKEGRLLTFPNTVQHQVSPFSLADPSKPGHRKILALFLIDPHRRIISSANVPPQREDWADERENAVDQVLSRLPMELQDFVKSDLEHALTMKEAKEYRLELMKERGLHSKRNNEQFERGDFSLCEH